MQTENSKARTRWNAGWCRGAGSCKCDCRQQLDYALGYIHDSGGIVVYLQQEGRGMGLGNKIKAYSLQEVKQKAFEIDRLVDSG